MQSYLGPEAPTPEEVATLLTFHAFEIEEQHQTDTDTIFELKILPDRGSDCLSQRGVAREIASLANKPLAYDPLATLPELPTTDAIAVSIENASLCPRFTAALITGVTVGPSPAWLQERLAALGARSINNIVDATNYVMYALGQPLHAYDADKFPKDEGVWHFGVRSAGAGDTVSLLAEGGKDEDRTVTLRGGELLITEMASGVAVGLAGVKGGRFAGVDADTKNIIIEAAHFDAGRTRKTARGLNIVIDASKRFENNPSRALPLYGQAAIAELIQEIAGGTLVGVVDAYPLPQSNPTVRISTAAVNARLGLSLSQEAMVAIVERIGARVEVLDEENFTAVAPFERTDLTIPEDFAEEIGRIYGYHHVASVVPEAVPLREVNARQYYTEKIRAVLNESGYSEIITSSFRKKDEIALLSALASDKGCMRSKLTPNLEEALDKNAPFSDLLGTPDTRLFEIGTVFHKSEQGIGEHVALAVGVRIRSSGYSGKEDAVIKTTTAAIDAMLGTPLSWQYHKGVAEANISEVLQTLPVPTAYDPIMVAPEVAYQPFSVFPSMSRDIAMWVPEGVASSEVVAILNNAAGPLRVRTTLFDEFKKEGRTSFAFRLVFQSMEKTLSDEEINPIMEQVYKTVTALGWETR